MDQIKNLIQAHIFDNILIISRGCEANQLPMLNVCYTLKIMFKKIILTFFLLTVGLLFPKVASAQSEFTVDSNVTYKIQESGKTLVTHNFSLENNFSTLYATTYTLSLANIDVQNPLALDLNGKQIPLEVQKENDQTKIKLTFKDAVVGKGAKRQFTISYENGSFAVRTGEIWEISIPKLGDPESFRNYAVNLEIPDSFGLEAYISPAADSYNNSYGYKNYNFSKEKIIETGITAGFGEFQVFSFNLSYHLENPLTIPATTEVALPPDTAFQKVYFTKIQPAPLNVTLDKDGNWLAKYKLGPRERIDVVAAGSVQIFASFRKFPKPTAEILSDNLRETEYWQVNDPKIKALAAELKTPKAIYEYVVKTLQYDYSRVTPNAQRFGAVKALENPKNAICMEFTDLFVALARAAGIPAREINGYAYTENPQLQPLSLVADVLHAWPEYYDSEKGAWIPVDPTWGSTSGIDYFSKLDLRHFTFVVHGENAVKPYPPGSYKLGPNPQKDVFVSFGKLPEVKLSTPKIALVDKKIYPFRPSSYKIRVENPGPQALYSLYPTIYFGSKEKSRDFVEILPPFANYEFEIKVPFSLLGKDTPEKIKITVDGAQIEIPTNKTQVVINSLVTIFAAFILILLGILMWLKKITFTPITGKIRAVYEKIARKIAKTKS